MIVSIFLKLLFAINLLQITIFGLSIFFDDIEDARRNAKYNELFKEWEKRENEKNKNK
jgi:hypothetical protein